MLVSLSKCNCNFYSFFSLSGTKIMSTCIITHPSKEVYFSQRLSLRKEEMMCEEMSKLPNQS